LRKESENYRPVCELNIGDWHLLDQFQEFPGILPCDVSSLSGLVNYCFQVVHFQYNYCRDNNFILRTEKPKCWFNIKLLQLIVIVDL